MDYEQLTELDDEAFKHYCGVRRKIFQGMLEVQRAAERAKRKSGCPSLSLEDQLPPRDRALALGRIWIWYS